MGGSGGPSGQARAVFFLGGSFMAHEVSELERLAGIVMAVERITFAEALLRVAEQYPLLRDAAMHPHPQGGSALSSGSEPDHEHE